VEITEFKKLLTSDEMVGSMRKKFGMLAVKMRVRGEL
jgi:hypothetical protein